MSTNGPILDIGSRQTDGFTRSVSFAIESEMAVQSSSFDALSDLSVAAVQSGGRQAIRILLAEANKEYADVLITALAERGIGVRHFADSREFLRTLDQAIDAHVIVLDWHMPRMSGIDLLAAIRRRGIKLPVVFLTGQNLIQYENQAFERGAMDFIEKSRGVETLVWRLKRVAISPGSDQAGAGCTAQGRLTLHRHVSRALWGGLDLHLTVGEYNVVELLALNAGNFIRYRAIYDALRSPGFVSGRGAEGYRANVRSALKRVRNKFRALDPDFDAIESYMAFGYRWNTGGDR
jgi:two-component system response regulator ChvI